MGRLRRMCSWTGGEKLYSYGAYVCTGRCHSTGDRVVLFDTKGYFRH
jgi:hypothetical protein